MSSGRARKTRAIQSRTSALRPADDPKLALHRLEAEYAEIWLDASSLVAGIRMLFGADPKQDYKDKVAEVRLQ